MNKIEKERRLFIEMLEPTVKQADPGIDHLSYKVSNDKEYVTVWYKSCAPYGININVTGDSLIALMYDLARGLMRK